MCYIDGADSNKNSVLTSSSSDKNMKSGFFYSPCFLLALITVLNSTSLKSQASSETMTRVKIAAVQISGYDKTVTPGLKINAAENAVKYIEQASSDTAQMVVFPEYYLGRISIPGRETKLIAEAAEKHGIYVIIGSWEVINDSTFRNAALLFDREGEIMGKYYKTHAAVDKYEGNPPYSQPPSGKDFNWFVENDPEWIMERGNAFPVFDLDFGRIGILTCYDGWFPEPFRILALKGAEILVWINSRGGSVEDYIVRTAMHHNSVSIVCTNQAYGKGTMIAEWPGNRIKAICTERKEDYIVEYLDLGRLRKARLRSRNAQQRRPDIYKEILKETPQ